MKTHQDQIFTSTPEKTIDQAINRNARSSTRSRIKVFGELKLTADFRDLGKTSGGWNCIAGLCGTDSNDGAQYE